MRRLDFDPLALDAILVTHEHSDHCSGVARLSRKYDVPVYLTRGTWASGRCEGVSSQHFFHAEEPFAIGDIEVLPIAVPHDAREPCQFVFNGGGLNLGVLTDLGSITPSVTDHYSVCDALLLECNHDLDMLELGPYPPALKARVGGDWGHLNNQQAAELLSELNHEQLQFLVIAHISEKNNCPERARDAVHGVFAYPERVVWADQSDGCEWLELHGA